jgi:septal ring factor EnvC (AmiA/AmiB activator)
METTIARQQNDVQASVAQQRKEMEILTASLKEQAAQIQKVNAQVEANKPSTQVAVNNW